MSSKLELKLVIEKKSQKVVFAEVRKGVVDFLLSLFALPMRSVINLITKDSSIGSLGNMYSSWDQMDDKFLHSTKMKASCLIPAIASASPTESSNFVPILMSTSPATITETLYGCRNCRYYFSDVSGSPCKQCHKLGSYCYDMMMCSQIGKYDGPNVTKEEVKNNGYAKSGLTYAVMDDLSMVPLTTSLASISLLSKMGSTI